LPFTPPDFPHFQSPVGFGRQGTSPYAVIFAVKPSPQRLFVQNWAQVVENLREMRKSNSETGGGGR